MTRLTTIEELCAALHDGGFVLTAIDRDAFSIKPRSAVSTELAAAIKRQSDRLQTFLVDRGPCTPHPCSDCGGEFVSTPSEPCHECRNRRGEPLRFRPNSPEEQEFVRFWMSGYYNAAANNNVLDYKRLQRNSAKVAAYCKGHKSDTLPTAIKKGAS